MEKKEIGSELTAKNEELSTVTCDSSKTCAPPLCEASAVSTVTENQKDAGDGLSAVSSVAKCGLVVVNMADVKEQKVDWLWQGRIPLKMLTILAGDPGLGKSILTLFMAATVSQGRDWPDENPCPQGEVAIFSNEDSLEHTVKPRLIALGANLDERKIHAVVGASEKDESGNEFQNFFVITKHYLMLEELLKQNPQIRLVIIDPLSAYFGAADTRVDAKVRHALAPLSQIADRYNVAVVCVMHLNKGNSSNILYRASGSLGFTAAARVMWFVCSDPNDDTGSRRFLLNAKMNIAERPAGLAFEIKEGAPVFEKDPVETRPEEILTKPSSIEAPERRRAIEWLKELLADGQSKPSNQIFKLAKEEDFNDRTLQRARKELGIKCFQIFDDKGNNSWHWRLPKKEGEQSKIPGLAKLLERERAKLKKFCNA
ncbi:MAG: AAA family ATPase [Sedimentisphaerales bacterium]|nr:AAA family ATPase [Sedimentisphaerales bacterium]